MGDGWTFIGANCLAYDKGMGVEFGQLLSTSKPASRACSMVSKVRFVPYASVACNFPLSAATGRMKYVSGTASRTITRENAAHAVQNQ